MILTILMILKKNKFEIGFIQGRLSKQRTRIQQFPWRYWKKEFIKAKKLKLDLIEWTIDNFKFFKNPLFLKEYFHKIKNLQKKNNIKINSVTADFFMEKPFWKQKRSQIYLNRLNLLINACGKHNINFIILPLVDNSSIKNLTEEKKIISNLSKFDENLKKYNVNILFEIDYKPQKILNFIKKFNRKYYGINYDLGNSASLSFKVKNEFNVYGKYIKNIHIKDRKRNGKTVRLGKGNANFKSLFKILNRKKNKLPLILQTARALKKGDDYKELEINLNFIKKYIS